MNLQPGKSYFIEPTGKLHEVESCMHHEFALNYIEKNHSDMLNSFPSNKGERLTVSERVIVSKDLIVGQLGWVTFTPLGDNTYVCDAGRDMYGKFSPVRFTRKQISILMRLWEANNNKLEYLENILYQNERYACL